MNDRAHYVTMVRRALGLSRRHPVYTAFTGVYFRVTVVYPWKIGDALRAKSALNASRLELIHGSDFRGRRRLAVCFRVRSEQRKHLSRETREVLKAISPAG